MHFISLGCFWLRRFLRLTCTVASRVETTCRVTSRGSRLQTSTATHPTMATSRFLVNGVSIDQPGWPVPTLLLPKLAPDDIFVVDIRDWCHRYLQLTISGANTQVWKVCSPNLEALLALKTSSPSFQLKAPAPTDKQSLQRLASTPITKLRDIAIALDDGDKIESHFSREQPRTIAFILGPRPAAGQFKAHGLPALAYSYASLQRRRSERPMQKSIVIGTPSG